MEPKKERNLVFSSAQQPEPLSDSEGRYGREATVAAGQRETPNFFLSWATSPSLRLDNGRKHWCVVEVVG